MVTGIAWASEIINSCLVALTSSSAHPLPILVAASNEFWHSVRSLEGIGHLSLHDLATSGTDLFVLMERNHTPVVFVV